GIAGALRKIGGLTAGSAMSSSAAGEASHMFFGQVGRGFMNGLLSTHPPLERRIRAVDPRWDGRFAVVTPLPDAAGAATGAAADAAVDAGVSRLDAGPGAPAAAAAEVADAVGRLDEGALAGAQRLIAGLPEALHAAAHEPYPARALMYALVMDQPAPYRQRQIEHLAAHAERGMIGEMGRLQAALAPLDEIDRMALVDLAVPALKQLSASQYRQFVGNLIALIKADQQIDLFEWVLHRLLVKDLTPHFEKPRPERARYGDLEALQPHVVVVLSALAREQAAPGAADGAAAQAFAAGMAELGATGALQDADDVNFARLNRALAELRQLKPLVKPRLIKACAAVVLADGQVSTRQAALLRGIAATMDCPLPPGVIQGH
ncbi:MAG: hypothetical protein RIE74_09220, partial [Pseudomonadales bacterium]